jgi:hypothetical protein
MFSFCRGSGGQSDVRVPPRQPLLLAADVNKTWFGLHISQRWPVVHGHMTGATRSSKEPASWHATGRNALQHAFLHECRPCLSVCRRLSSPNYLTWSGLRFQTKNQNKIPRETVLHVWMLLEELHFISVKLLSGIWALFGRTGLANKWCEENLILVRIRPTQPQTSKHLTV